jgi:hypothetical protein
MGESVKRLGAVRSYGSLSPPTRSQPEALVELEGAVAPGSGRVSYHLPAGGHGPGDCSDIMMWVLF